MGKEIKRLLGIISYYDCNNEFGFIDTNGYGIEVLKNSDISEHIELYFRKSDIQDYTVIHQGQWVSFIHEKLVGKKRDRARKIKIVRYSEDDYALALNYRNEYFGIETKMMVYDYDLWSDRKHKELVYLEILPHFTNKCLLKNQSKQFVFNSLISAYARHLFDVPQLFMDMIDQIQESESYSFEHVDQSSVDNLFGFVINPDKEGIIVNDSDILEDLLSDLSICVFKRVNEYRSIDRSIDYYSLFSSLVIHISDKGLNKIRLAIQALYDRAKGEDQARFAYKLYHMPIETANVLFGSYGFNPSPELRNIIYRIQRNVNVLLDDTMIDYWNMLVEENKYPFSFEEGPVYNGLSFSIPQEIGDYLSKSEKPNDLLLLWGFVESKVPDCFRRIKDKSVCYSSILLLDSSFIHGYPSYFLRKYLSLAKMIPEDILEKLFNYVGLKRIVSCSIDKENYKYFPKSITIQIEVVVTVNSQRQFSETVESSGRFTWGEGYQPSFTTYTYLQKNCSATIYVDSQHHRILKNNILTVKIIIANELPGIISQNKTSCLLTCPTPNQTYLIALYIQESYDAEYKLLIPSINFSATNCLHSERL